MFYLRVRGGMLLGASRTVQYAALIKKTGRLPCIIETLTSVCPCVCLVDLEWCRTSNVENLWLKMQSILIIILTCNFFPDGVLETLNYFNFVSLKAGTQHCSNCQQQESTPERKTMGNKRQRNPWSSWAVSWPLLSPNGGSGRSQVVLEWLTPWLCIRIQRSPQAPTFL